MKLRSGRSVVGIQRDGYQELIPTEGDPLLTPAEWDEFCVRHAKENNLRIVERKATQVQRNREAFEADKKAGAR